MSQNLQVTKALVSVINWMIKYGDEYVTCEDMHFNGTIGIDMYADMLQNLKCQGIISDTKDIIRQIKPKQ